jgi:hypothetical protein
LKHKENWAKESFHVRFAKKWSLNHKLNQHQNLFWPKFSRLSHFLSRVLTIQKKNVIKRDVFLWGREREST